MCGVVRVGARGCFDLFLALLGPASSAVAFMPMDVATGYTSGTEFMTCHMLVGMNLKGFEATSPPCLVPTSESGQCS